MLILGVSPAVYVSEQVLASYMVVLLLPTEQPGVNTRLRCKLLDLLTLSLPELGTLTTSNGMLAVFLAGRELS